MQKTYTYFLRQFRDELKPLIDKYVTNYFAVEQLKSVATAIEYLNRTKPLIIEEIDLLDSEVRKEMRKHSISINPNFEQKVREIKLVFLFLYSSKITLQ